MLLNSWLKYLSKAKISKPSRKSSYVEAGVFKKNVPEEEQRSGEKAALTSTSSEESTSKTARSNASASDLFHSGSEEKRKPPQKTMTICEKLFGKNKQVVPVDFNLDVNLDNNVNDKMR